MPPSVVVQEESLMRPLVEVEMPLVHVLQRMEAVGIAVDVAIFEKHRVHLLIYAKLCTHAAMHSCTHVSAVTAWQLATSENLNTATATRLTERSIDRV